jgi:hypothetical protein
VKTSGLAILSLVARFEAFTAMKILVEFFRVVMPYSVVASQHGRHRLVLPLVYFLPLMIKTMDINV